MTLSTFCSKMGPYPGVQKVMNAAAERAYLRNVRMCYCCLEYEARESVAPKYQVKRLGLPTSLSYFDGDFSSMSSPQ